MSLRFRAIETLDYRVLGAVRFVDAGTGQKVDVRLDVQATAVRWTRNRSNLYVVAEAPGLASLTTKFEYPDPPPATGTVTVAATVRDASGRYLPRAFSLALPRDANPANAANATSLFRPVEVALYPSPTAAAVGGWASVRAKVLDNATGAALEGALVRVVKPAAGPVPEKVLARGLSDARGEAFVPLPGIPFMTWSDDEHAVLTSTVNVRIEAYADPAAARPVNPDTLEANRATLPFDQLTGVPVKAGTTVTAILRIRPRSP